MISCIISFLGSILSFIGTYFSYIQYKRTKTVKESVEEFRDEIVIKQQLIEFSDFLKVTNKFLTSIQNASNKSVSQGKDKEYLNIELEKYLTKFNRVIATANNNTKNILNQHYKKLELHRSKIDLNNKNSILSLIDDIRNLERSMTESQINNQYAL